MVDQAWNMKKNQIAEDRSEGNECDGMWRWVVRYYERLALFPVNLEGVVVETTLLEGTVDITQFDAIVDITLLEGVVDITLLEGVVDEDSEIEGEVGIG